MSADCIFCKIGSGQIPATKVLEDEEFFAIRDIHPQAPTHLLVIPKRHVRDVCDAARLEDGSLFLGRLWGFAARVALQAELETQGFRTVINTGVQGGQTVFHLHIHVLGGRTLSTFA